MTIFGRITGGRDAPYPEPSGSPLGDALSAVAACAHAAVAFHGRTAADWEPLLGLLGLARTPFDIDEVNDMLSGLELASEPADSATEPEHSLPGPLDDLVPCHPYARWQARAAAAAHMGQRH